MNHYSMAPQGCHWETAPDGKFFPFDRKLSPVFNTDTAQSRIVRKLAQRHGLSVPLARAVAELAGLNSEVME
ncbi:hypothetical protein ACETIH_06585 [Microvirga arabica]|uniref:Uncharacterized protein n=1 Tax=Microvirga arabica TaxID=1128671 RepID=A0ABV6Y548_9HYPH